MAQRKPAPPTRLFALLWLLIAAVASLGAQDFQVDLDYAQVRDVRTTLQSTGTWRFDVTVEHNDTGWEHYADAWQILDAESGDVLGERTLLHPHVDEMPFTRSLANVTIPPGVSTVRVRARCNVHGYGGTEVTVDLAAIRGE